MRKIASFLVNPYRFEGRKKYAYWAFCLLFAAFIVTKLSDPEYQAEMARKRIAESSKDLYEDYVRIGQTQRAGYFDVQVKDFSVGSGVASTENSYVKVMAPEGTGFVIVSASFKNVDTEGRTLFSSGELTVEYAGKEYTIDKTQPVPAKGFGVFLEPLNPMVTYSTALVFPVASEMHGPVFWTPDRGSKVYLGQLERADR